MALYAERRRATSGRLCSGMEAVEPVQPSSGPPPALVLVVAASDQLASLLRSYRETVRAGSVQGIRSSEVDSAWRLNALTPVGRYSVRMEAARPALLTSDLEDVISVHGQTVEQAKNFSSLANVRPAHPVREQTQAQVRPAE